MAPLALLATPMQSIAMLQITEYNISLKPGFQKSAGFHYDWKGMGVPNVAVGRWRHMEINGHR